jgi:hypothetical protein
MSAFGGKADVTTELRNVCFGPKADVAPFQFAGLNRYDGLCLLRGAR